MFCFHLYQVIFDFVELKTVVWFSSSIFSFPFIVFNYERPRVSVDKCFPMHFSHLYIWSWDGQRKELHFVYNNKTNGTYSFQDDEWDLVLFNRTLQ